MGDFIPNQIPSEIQKTKLVGGFKHEFYFPFHIWDVILPIDDLIFFKMVKTFAKTTNQIIINNH